MPAPQAASASVDEPAAGPPPMPPFTHPVRPCYPPSTACTGRFVCEFEDVVPEAVYSKLPPSAQRAFQRDSNDKGAALATAHHCAAAEAGVDVRRAQYYVMAMHTVSLETALLWSQVG